jgi:hypothetical protein
MPRLVSARLVVVAAVLSLACSASVGAPGTQGSGTKPVIASFSANPPTIAAGGSTSLRWTVTGADALSIDQGVGVVTGQTSITAAPSATTRYTLTATNAAGSTTASVDVTVSTGPLPPEILSFGANPQTVAPGGSATLSWTVTGATSLSIDQGVGAVTGSASVQVHPSATTQYTLSATSAGGTRTAVTVVQVAGSCAPSTASLPAGPSFRIPGTTTTSSLSRTIPWKPGVPDGVPYRTTICRTLSPGGGDDGAAINAALQACPEGQVVQLTAGVYRIETGVTFPRSRLTLRGTGGPGTPDAARAKLIAGPRLYGHIVAFSGAQLVAPGSNTAKEADLAEVALQGSSTLALARGTASRFRAGDLVILDQKTSPANEAMFAPWSGVADPNKVTWEELVSLKRQTYALWPFDLNPDGSLKVEFPYAMFGADMPPRMANRGNDRRYERPIAQVGEIAAVDPASDTVTLRTPLHFTFAPALEAKLGGTTAAATEGNGLEDLFVGSEPPAADWNNRGGIGLGGTKRSWVRNVELDHVNVLISAAYQCTFRDSYVHEVHGLPSPGGGGYGIYVERGSSDNLVENNMVWNFNKVMVAPGTGPGNVYAYNYMDDGWIAYNPNFVESGMEASHGSTPTYALFEGNLTFNLGTDPTHGNNILMTWLRNLSTIHRAAWPPLNAYRLEKQPDDSYKQSTCVPPAGYSDRCVAYTDWSGRAGVSTTFGDYFFSYVGNVIGSDDTPLDPHTGSAQFVYESTQSGVPIWDVGQFQVDGMTPRTDDAVMATLWRDGNYDIVTRGTRWAAGAHAIPESFYLCSKPAFFGSWTWPWVDGTNASSRYVRHPYRYYPLMKGVGTFVTPDLDRSAQPTTQYQGYALPAFVRFLQLREIEGKLADCAGSTVASPSAACQLLLTGTVPQ